MSSLFKLNQLSIQLEDSPTFEEPKIALESQDKEIYALRQQLQTLKTLYKNAKAQKEHSSKKNPVGPPVENEYSKQRIEKLMAVLADREKQMRMMQADVKLQHMQLVDECRKEKQAKLVALEEITALHGQLDFLKSKVTSSQNVLKAYLEKIELLEGQFFQEKRRQEHLQDSLKDTESLAGTWEKKYFELYAKWEDLVQPAKEISYNVFD